MDNEVERKATIRQWALIFAAPIRSGEFFWNSCGGTREEIICRRTGCFPHRVDTLTGTPLQSNSTRCIHSAADNTNVPPLFSLCADFIKPLLIQLYGGFFFLFFLDRRDLILSCWVRCSDGRVFLGPGDNRVLRGNYPIGGNIGGEFGLCDVTLLPVCVSQHRKNWFLSAWKITPFSLEFSKTNIKCFHLSS